MIPERVFAPDRLGRRVSRQREEKGVLRSPARSRLDESGSAGCGSPGKLRWCM